MKNEFVSYACLCRYIPKYVVQKERKLQHVAFSWLRSSHLTISRDSILRAAKRSDYTGNDVLSGSKHEHHGGEEGKEGWRELLPVGQA